MDGLKERLVGVQRIYFIRLESATKRLNMRKPPTCPTCNRFLDLHELKEWICPFCGADFSIDESYRHHIGKLTLASMIFLGVLSHRSYSGGTWLLVVILSGIPIWIIFIRLIPLRLRSGRQQPKIRMMSTYLGMVSTVFLAVFLTEFLGLGGLMFITGATRNNVQEHFQILSMPLAWISTNFLITPNNSFSDVCGVILGNSFFYGLLMFTCYQPIRWIFRRSRPTQLSLTGGLPTDDDE
jgi:hypothetical protein